MFFSFCFPHLSVAVYDTETVDRKSGLQLIRTVSFDRAMECDANKEGWPARPLPLTGLLNGVVRAKICS